MNGYNDGHVTGRGPGAGPGGFGAPGVAGGDPRDRTPAHGGFVDPGAAPAHGGFVDPGAAAAHGGFVDPGAAAAHRGGAPRRAGDAGPGAPGTAAAPRPEPRAHWFAAPEATRRRVERRADPAAGDGGSAWAPWAAVVAQIGVIGVIVWWLIEAWRASPRTSANVESGVRSAGVRPENLEILTMLWGLVIVVLVAGIVGCVLRGTWGRYLLTAASFPGLLLLLGRGAFIAAGVLCIATIVLLWLPASARWFRGRGRSEQAPVADAGR